MNLRWCAITGAVMIVITLFTGLSYQQAGDPPGTTTRWWDGTLRTVEQHYSNGRLARRTEYGVDGKTVLAYREWNGDGTLIVEKVRREDGLFEDKRFSDDGKTLREYTLWNGDLQTYRQHRRYYNNGVLAEEQIYTDNGQIRTANRSWDSQGRMTMEQTIDDNADQRTDYYRDGKITSRDNFKANGDRVAIQFYSNGKIATSTTVFQLDRSQLEEYFDDQGVILWRMMAQGYPRTQDYVITAFTGGQQTLKQTFVSAELTSVEQYDAAGQLSRKLVVSNGLVKEAHRYRSDGTLQRISYLNPYGAVIKHTDYDASGKAGATVDRGEDELVAPELLQATQRPKIGVFR